MKASPSTPAPPGRRIALACSGLGHVRRGNETWAREVGSALWEAGADVTLFGGGPNPESRCPYVRLPCLRRDLPVARRWVSWSHRYLVEQLTFLLALRRQVLRRGIECLHLCDPDLALQMHRRTDPARLRVVFKDGMLLGPSWCSRLRFVQVLAPYYRDVLAREAGVPTDHWFVIPHLVDPEAFRPGSDRGAARRALAGTTVASDAFVVLGVGDFSTVGNKRLDWLVRETAALPPEHRAHLLLAGQAADAEFARFETMARSALGGRVSLFRNLPRPEMARLYQAADVFAHAATREPFGIVFLEAMASGLPVVGHRWEVTRWIIGDGGETLDMTAAGALGGLLRRWAAHPAECAAVGARARARAVECFSASRLVPRYLEMYEHMVRTT